MHAESPDPADRAIAALAAKQHGVATRQQLEALGLGRGGAIAHRVATGRLYPIHRGVFLVGHPVPMGRAPEMAAVLACGPGAAIGHLTAAAMLALPCGPAPRLIDVVIGRSWAPKRPGIRIHRTLSLTRRDVHWVDRVPVTSPARTLLDLGVALDRVTHEIVVAAALRRPLVRRVDLEEQLARNGQLHGAAALRSILEADEGPALSGRASDARVGPKVLLTPPTSERPSGHVRGGLPLAE